MARGRVTRNGWKLTYKPTMKGNGFAKPWQLLLKKLRTNKLAFDQVNYMADTQWPRFQVFLQEQSNSPHQDVGSVHASDAEMALLNARDVFVRRPECHGLWVVPADCIYSKTADELKKLTSQIRQETQHLPSEKPKKYSITCKTKPAGTQTYLGEVEAGSPEIAMQLALKLLSFETPPFAIWVFPTNLIISSDPEEETSWFLPARDKLFRMAIDFHTHTTMRKIKNKSF